ncbi:MAG: hypothetical protein FJZ86_09030 [Chloroflexi bacterium]|nr:hypothetical protein [Chloroflexota bacterium]
MKFSHPTAALSLILPKWADSTPSCLISPKKRAPNTYRCSRIFNLPNMQNLAQLLRVPHVDNGLRFDISPDGQRLAFAWNKTGRWQLWQMSHLHWRAAQVLRGREPEAIPNSTEDCFG